MAEQTKTVLRHEVPIDDKPHTFKLTYGPHAVAAKRVWSPPHLVIHNVEFWVEHDDTLQAVGRTFQVVGTGHPIPTSARLIGTTERLDGLVWHLYELFPGRLADDAEFSRLFPHAEGGDS